MIAQWSFQVDKFYKLSKDVYLHMYTRVMLNSEKLCHQTQTQLNETYEKKKKKKKESRHTKQHI